MGRSLPCQVWLFPEAARWRKDLSVAGGKKRGQLPLPQAPIPITHCYEEAEQTWLERGWEGSGWEQYAYFCFSNFRHLLLCTVLPACSNSRIYLSKKNSSFFTENRQPNNTLPYMVGPPNWRARPSSAFSGFRKLYLRQTATPEYICYHPPWIYLH